jgi:ABC-type transporter Mla subunit MlaD
MEHDSRSAGEDLAQIADELLEHTRALRRQHEELRDALAGVAPAAAPVSSNGHGDEDERGLPDSVHAMALQMALAGESRESVKGELQTLQVVGGDEIVDEVFDRIEARRDEGKRRLFSRRTS